MRRRRRANDASPRTPTAALGRLAYWIAVVAISLALVVALILFFESRDASSVSGPDTGRAAAGHTG